MPPSAPPPVKDRRKKPRQLADRRQTPAPTDAQLYASSFKLLNNERRTDLLARQNEAIIQTRIWRQIMLLCSGIIVLMLALAVWGFIYGH